MVSPVILVSLRYYHSFLCFNKFILILFFIILVFLTISCFMHFISVLVSFQFSLLVMENGFKMWMQRRMSDLMSGLKNRKSFMDMVYKNLSYISKEEEARVSQNNIH